MVTWQLYSRDESQHMTVCHLTPEQHQVNPGHPGHHLWSCVHCHTVTSETAPTRASLSQTRYQPRGQHIACNNQSEDKKHFQVSGYKNSFIELFTHLIRVLVNSWTRNFGAISKTISHKVSAYKKERSSKYQDTKSHILYLPEMEIEKKINIHFWTWSRE